MAKSGLNKNTKNEATIFLEHVDLAVEYDQQILIHTPHLEDKYQGTRMILDMLCDDSPSIVRGCWSITSKNTRSLKSSTRILGGDDALPDHQVHAGAGRRHDRTHGVDRMMVNSAGDWGPSKPTAVPDLILEMRRRGHNETLIRKVVYENPLAFFSKCRQFQFTPRDVGYEPAN